MKPRITPIQETKRGIYVWEMPDGRWVADEEENFLSIPAVEGSPRAIEAITKEARHYVSVGKPLFLPGRRQITDEEYEHQLTRQAAGLVPDPYDYSAMEEEIKYGRSD